MKTSVSVNAVSLVVQITLYVLSESSEAPRSLTDGVPLIVAVPSPLSLTEIHEGSAEVVSPALFCSRQVIDSASPSGSVEAVVSKLYATSSYAV